MVKAFPTTFCLRALWMGSQGRGRTNRKGHGGHPALGQLRAQPHPQQGHVWVVEGEKVTAEAVLRTLGGKGSCPPGDGPSREREDVGTRDPRHGEAGALGVPELGPGSRRPHAPKEPGLTDHLTLSQPCLAAGGPGPEPGHCLGSLACRALSSGQPLQAAPVPAVPWHSRGTWVSAAPGPARTSHRSGW